MYNSYYMRLQLLWWKPRCSLTLVAVYVNVIRRESPGLPPIAIDIVAVHAYGSAIRILTQFITDVVGIRFVDPTWLFIVSNKIIAVLSRKDQLS